MRSHIVAVAVAAATLFGCKTPAPEGAGTLEAAASPCATLEARVKSLELELAQLGTATTPANADGEAACKDAGGTKWNAEIGRCECLTDPTKFSGNAWSIRNTLKCEVAVDSFKACKAKTGARWNAEVGRCECITDPNKFSGNAWSIKNTLTCQAATDSWKACKEVHGAKWNDTIGRCECANDASKFQGNAFSIRQHLKCEGETAAETCVKADEFLNDGTFALADGLELTRDKETVEKELAAAVASLKSCRQGAASVPAQPTKGACIFVRADTKQVQATCTPDTDQAGCDRSYAIIYQSKPEFERRLVVGKDCDTAKNEAASQGSKGSTNPSQVASTEDAAGACLLKSNTTSKEYCQTLTKKRCDGWLDRNATKFSLVSFNPNAACAQSASSETTSFCSCSFSGDGRYCGVWRDGKLIAPYFGPLGTGWKCDATSVSNNLCNTDSLKQILASQGCQ